MISMTGAWPGSRMHWCIELVYRRIQVWLNLIAM